MQATQRLPSMSLAPARTVASSPPAPAFTSDDEPAMPPFERWTERFCHQIVAWGDAATHHRMGSWTQRTLR